jgi:pantoate--beta-alanine ligase
MYPEHYQTFVDVEGVTRNLCGLSRPCHFRGVTTICAKLFNIVKPHVAIFGKKDFQQLVTVKRMVADLNMDIEIIGMPTVRDPDGLAISSRNTYLKKEERKSALSLIRSIKLAKELYDNGKRETGKIIEAAQKFIEGHRYTKIDYVKICDAATLNDIEYIQGEAVLMLAVEVGIARLIDSYVFGNPLDI